MALTKDDLQAIKNIVEDAVEDSKLQTAAGFEAVDKRFESIDNRFKSVDKRFESIDKRFESMDKRFDIVDQRFDDIEMTLGKIENIQRVEVERVDQHAKDITSIRRKLKLA